MDKALIKNITALFGIQGMNYVIPLITLPYLVRVLDPIGYGSLGFSLAIVQYCCILTDYGFNLSATQQVAVHRDDKQKVSEIFWSVIVCKVLMATISLLLMVLTIEFVPKLKEVSDIIYASLLMVLGNLIFPTWLFQGMEKMGTIAVANIISRLFAIPLIFFFVLKPEDAYIAALITSFTTIIAGLISLYLILRNHWIVWFKPSFLDLKKMMSDGWHVFISTAAVSLYTSSTTVILGFISGPVAVGYFVAADKLRQAAQGLITPVAQSFYPRINSTMVKSKAEGFTLIRTLLKWQGGGAFLISLAIFIFAPIIIDLAYGDTYKPAIRVLYLMAWLPFIVSISNVFGIQTLLVLGFKSIFSRILIAAGFINLLLIFPLTFLYSETGAAYSVLITEIAVTLMMFVVIIKKKLSVFKGEANEV